MRLERIAATLILCTLAAASIAQSTQGAGSQRGSQGGADQGSVGTTPERQVRRDNTTTRHHTRVYGPVNGGGRQYHGSSNGLQDQSRRNHPSRHSKQDDAYSQGADRSTRSRP